MSLEDRLRDAKPQDPDLRIKNLQPALRGALTVIGPRLYGVADETRRWVEAKTLEADTEYEKVQILEHANKTFAKYLEEDLLKEPFEDSEASVRSTLRGAIREHLTYRGVIQRRLHEKAERLVKDIGASEPKRYFRVEVTDLSGDVDPAQTKPLAIDYSLQFVRDAVVQSVNQGHSIDPNEDVRKLSQILEEEHGIPPCHMELPDQGDFLLEDQAMFALDVLFRSGHTHGEESHEPILESILTWAQENYGSSYTQSDVVAKIKSGEIRLQTHNVTEYGENSSIDKITSRLKRQEGWKAWYKLLKGDIPTDSVGLQIVTRNQETSYSVLAGLKMNANSCVDDSWRSDCPTLQTLETIYRTRLDEAGITSRSPTQDVRGYLYRGSVSPPEESSGIKKGIAMRKALGDFKEYIASYQDRLAEDRRTYFVEQLAPWETTESMEGRDVLSGLRASWETTVPTPKGWESIHKHGVPDSYRVAVGEVQILTAEEKTVFEDGITPEMVRGVGSESDQIEMQYVLDSLQPRVNYPVSHLLYAGEKENNRREKAYQAGLKEGINVLETVYWDIDQSRFFTG